MIEMFEMLVYKNGKEIVTSGGQVLLHLDIALKFLDGCIDSDIVTFKFYKL